MHTRRIRSLAWEPPVDWLSWSPADLGEARNGASALADGPAVDGLMAAVTEFDRILTRQAPGTAGAALWVPDASNRAPCATAALRVTAPDAERRWGVEELLSFAREGVTVPRGAKVLDVAALPTTTPCGDGVLQIVDTRRRISRRVSREWAWYLLPPGTEETVLLQVESDLVGLFGPVGDLAAEIAHTITVELEST